MAGKKGKGKRVINGTHGSAWINGEKLWDLNKIELKVTIEWEDHYFTEDTGKHRKYLGWVGEGSLELKKIYSRGINLLAKAVKSGQMPDITITTKLADPDAYGTERVSVSDVTFNEFLLALIENRASLTEELSFEFADFDIIEEIKSQVLAAA